ncbi:Patatin-like phospholipase [Variovorax boronicumulans]|nr:Patatin-like phospholipase [Variovorax boronicumulans]
MPETSPATGLLLTGGGARAAYQVGVLEAIAEIRRDAVAAGAAIGGGNPFQIITGTSAGAINAAALACGADDFDRVVAHIAQVWGEFRAEQIYRADSLSVLGSGARWRMLLGLGRFAANWMRIKPKSLLDNTPLACLLQRLVPLDRLPTLMQQGHVQALAVTASSYSSGEHVTFFEAAVPMEPWVRSQRLSVRDRITHAHLMASSAIPFVFPATALPMPPGHTEYFGDGSMRQSAPIAAAIHLGAQRIVVIGAGRMHEPRDEDAPNTHSGYPTMAQIAGHALSSIFLDALAVDIERLRPHQPHAGPHSRRGARSEHAAPARPAGDLAVGAHRHDRGAPRRRAAGRRAAPAGRLEGRGRREGRRARQLPAVRVGLHARAHGAGARGRDAPA